MKANRKFKEEKAGVSAVIGVILMVAITVAIATTVYLYASGMISGLTSQSAKVIPEIQFIQMGNNLVVQKTPTGVAWSALTVTGTGTVPSTGDVTVGQSITGCSGVVTIAYQNSLVGTFTF